MIRFVLPLWVEQAFCHLSHGNRLRRLLGDGTTEDLFHVSGEAEEIDATIVVMVIDGLPWIDEHINSEAVYRKAWVEGGRFYNFEVKVMGAVYLGLLD